MLLSAADLELGQTTVISVCESRELACGYGENVKRLSTSEICNHSLELADHASSHFGSIRIGHGAQEVLRKCSIFLQIVLLNEPGQIMNL